MKLTDRVLLRLEFLLVYRSRWVLALLGILLVVPIFAGVAGTFAFVKREMVTLENFRSLYQDQFEQWVIHSEDNRHIRDAIMLLHPATGPNYFLSMLAVLGSMVTPLWGAHFIGSEFSWQTARVRAAHAGWGQVVTAKLICLLGLSVWLAGLFAIMGMVVNRIAWQFALDAFWLTRHVQQPDLSVSLWQQMAVVSLGLTLYGAFGALGALITRSSLAGAMIGLAFPYLEWMIIGAPSWGWALPRIAYGNLLVGNFRYFIGGFASEPLGLVLPPAAWVSWAAVLFWCVLLGGTTFLLARRQEIH